MWDQLKSKYTSSLGEDYPHDREIEGHDCEGWQACIVRMKSQS